MRLWYRAKAKIRRICSGGVSSETTAARLSPANRLPQEIVEMIIGHLFYDPFSLRACSFTCYSWYIAAVRHLHSSLVTPTYRKDGNRKLWWHDSFRSMHKLGLLPLVRKLRIRGTQQHPDQFGPTTFSPKLFDCRILRQFSSLTNVQELGIDFLDIPSFMPLKFRRYFGHFLPTLRSLALREPKGSRRQIIFFIGLFQHLEDLRFRYKSFVPQEEPTDDPTLVPLFIPPLRGRLTLSCFTRVGILEDMINLFGGIRFRHMDLSAVNGVRLLLDASAKTLETLRLYPNGRWCKEARLKGVQVSTDNFSATFTHAFDLSQNKTLRALEVTMYNAVCPAFIRNLGHAISTIRSPAFSEVIVIYQERDMYSLLCKDDGPPSRLCSTPTYEANVASRRHKVFAALLKLRRARDFKLVVCVDVWGCARRLALRELKQAILAKCTEGGVENMSSQLTVTSTLQQLLPPPGEPMRSSVTISDWVHPWAPPPVGYKYEWD